ncbi:MAG: MBL fold metallo-hydrolase [Chloroflexota bacterium]
MFSGDLIFQGSVGRTDLPGGDWETLVESIREQVFTLPEETRLLSGHGEGTRVGEAK